MSNYQKWFFAALVAAAGAYFFVDANESVRNLLSILVFCVFAFYGESEIGKKELKETDDRLWNQLRELESKVEALEAEVDCKDD